MPYIKQDRRNILDNCWDIPRNAGELNYCVTKLCNKYVHSDGLDYQHINDVIGALEAAKLEFYRRLVTPYEDQKIKANGDVYA